MPTAIPMADNILEYLNIFFPPWVFSTPKKQQQIIQHKENKLLCFLGTLAES